MWLIASEQDYIVEGGSQSVCQDYLLPNYIMLVNFNTCIKSVFSQHSAVTAVCTSTTGKCPTITQCLWPIIIIVKVQGEHIIVILRAVYTRLTQKKTIAFALRIIPMVVRNSQIS